MEKISVLHRNLLVRMLTVLLLAIFATNAQAEFYVKAVSEVVSSTASSATYGHTWYYRTSPSDPWTSNSNWQGVLADTLSNAQMHDAIVNAVDMSDWPLTTEDDVASLANEMISTFTGNDLSHYWTSRPYDWYNGTLAFSDGVTVTVTRTSQTEDSSGVIPNWYEAQWSIVVTRSSPPEVAVSRTADLKGIEVDVTSSHSSSSANWAFAVYPDGTQLADVSLSGTTPQGAIATATASGAKPVDVAINLPVGYSNRGTNVEVLVLCEDNGQVAKVMVAGPPPPYLSGGSIASSTGGEANAGEIFVITFTPPKIFNPNTSSMMAAWSDLVVEYAVDHGDGTVDYDGSTVVTGWANSSALSGNYTVTAPIGSMIQFGYNVYNDILGDYMTMNSSGSWVTGGANWSDLYVMVADRNPSVSLTRPAAGTILSPGQSVSLGLSGTANDDNDLKTFKLQQSVNGGSFTDVQTWDISGESWSTTHSVTVPSGVTSVQWRGLVHDENRSITTIVDTDFARTGWFDSETFQINTPPVATFEGLPEGQNVAIGETLSFTGNGTDADANLDSVTIYYQVKLGDNVYGSLIQIATSNPSTDQSSIAVPIEKLVNEAPGTEFRFVAIASDGITSHKVETPDFKAFDDNQPPTAEWEDSTTKLTLYVGEAVNLGVTFYDGNNNLGNAHLKRNGTIVHTTTDVSGGNYPHSHTWTPASTGEYIFKWEVFDDGGKSGTSSKRTINVKAYPTVAINCATTPFTNNKSHSFIINATDADTDLAEIERRYRSRKVGSFWSGYSAVSTATVSGSSATTSYGTSAIEPMEPGGQYEVSARAIDSLNRDSGWETEVYTIANTPPNISWEEPVPTEMTSGGTVTLTATGADVDGFISKIELRKSSGAVVYTKTLAESNTLTSSAASYEFTETIPGTYAFYWKVTDSSGASASTALKSVSIGKADQTITFSGIPDKLCTDPVFDLSATASSGLPVSFTVTGGPATIYSGDGVSINGTGTVTIRASQSGNDQYSAASNKYRSFTVSKADQNIAFPAISDKLLSASDFSVNPTASSGLPVSISVSGAASLVNGKIRVNELGTATVTATQPGDGCYSAAPSVSRSFKVYLNGQTITFAPIEDKVYGDADFNLVASASSGLPVSFSVVSGPVSLSGNEVSIYGVGDVTIRASQGGNAYVPAAPSVDRSFTITKAPQTISLDAIADKLADDPDFTVNATASSGLPVSLSLSGPAALSGTTLSLTGTGTVTVTANQSGNAYYRAAPTVSRTFAVALDYQTINFAAISDKLLSASDFSVNPTASSGLPVSISVSGAASLVNGKIRVNELGTATVTATQPGNAEYAPATPVSRSFDVYLDGQTITFEPIEDKVYGDADFNLVASASSGLPVSFTVMSGPVTLSGDEVSINGVGTVTIRASQPGTAYVPAAPSVDRSFTVSKAQQTIAFSAIGTKGESAEPFSPNATASSGLPVGISTSDAAVVDYQEDLLVIVGTGTAVITATQPGNSFYEAAEPVSRTVTVTSNPPTIGGITLITHPFMNDRLHQFLTSWDDPDGNMDRIEARYFYQAPGESSWTESNTLESTPQSGFLDSFVLTTGSVDGADGSSRKMPHGLYRLEMRAVDQSGAASGWASWEGPVLNRSPMVSSDQDATPEQVKFANTVAVTIIGRDLDGDMGQGFVRVFTGTGGEKTLQSQSALGSNPGDPHPGSVQKVPFGFEARYPIGTTITLEAAFEDSGELTFTEVASYTVVEQDPVVSASLIESKALPAEGMEIWFTDSETVSESVNIAQDYTYPEQ